MKKILLQALFIGASTLSTILSTMALDLVVQENGPIGTYSSIASAVAVANDGDRVFINNRGGNVPWLETVTITKSIQLLSAVNDSMFTVQGNYIIAPIAAGKEITIIGMRNASGSILANSDAPAGARCKVNIMASFFNSGPVQFDYNNYNVNLTGNVFSQTVTIRFGKVIGNSWSIYSDLYIKEDAQATNDTVFVIGNRGFINSTIGTYFRFQTKNQHFYCVNNYMFRMIISDAKVSTSSNIIYNNSINANTINVNNPAIYIYPANPLSVTAKIEIMNNAIVALSTNNVVTQSGWNISNILYSYNMVNSTVNDLPNDGTNTVNSFTISSTGQPTLGQDMGNPDASYNDIDLTRNDVGCYGGSFTLNNYFLSPNSLLPGGGSRVYFVNMPHKVKVGDVINIKASSYDK